MWDVNSSLGFCVASLAKAALLVLSIFIGKVVYTSFIYTFIIFMLEVLREADT